MRCGFGSERQFSLESVSKLLKADPDASMDFPASSPF